MTAAKETKDLRAMRLLVNAWIVTHPIWRSAVSRKYGFPKGWGKLDGNFVCVTEVNAPDFIYLTEAEARAARKRAAVEYALRVLAEREGV